MPSLPRSNSRAQSRKQADKRYDDKRKKNPALARAAKLRSSQRWKDVRMIKLKHNPICEDPFKEHGKLFEVAHEVHHIKEVAKHPELCFTLTNLASLCTECHNKLSMYRS